jgi:hypothetical protein
MQPLIVNVDVLDDREPTVLVQKDIYPDRTFQVFRKPTDEDEEFTVSPGVIVDRALFWGIGRPLFDTPDDLALLKDDDEDDLLEVFALVYLDEDSPPVHKGEEPPDSNEQVAVMFDPEAGTYVCENCFEDYEGIDDITAPTLDEAIALGVDRLHTILAKDGGAAQAEPTA